MPLGSRSWTMATAVRLQREEGQDWRGLCCLLSLDLCRMRVQPHWGAIPTHSTQSLWPEQQKSQVVIWVSTSQLGCLSLNYKVIQSLLWLRPTLLLSRGGHYIYFFQKKNWIIKFIYTWAKNSWKKMKRLVYFGMNTFFEIHAYQSKKFHEKIHVLLNK